jgi:hypothetical protein
MHGTVSSYISQFLISDNLSVAVPSRRKYQAWQGAVTKSSSVWPMSIDTKMDIQQFPHLDKAEFSEACHHLDRRYCQAKLGALRRRWKLRLCTALDLTFSLDGGYTTYVQITRPLDADASHDELSLGLDKFSISKEEDAFAMGEQDMMDAENADEVTRPNVGRFNDAHHFAGRPPTDQSCLG